MLRQIIAISLTSLSSVRSRIGGSVVVIVGVAGVVFVLTALFAMTNGLREALSSTGRADRVLLLGKGSNSEINGSITRENAAIIADKPGIAATQSLDGVRVPLASGEIYAGANLPRTGDAGRSALPLRGVSADAFRVRPEVRVTAGRVFEPGKFELLVGSGATGVFDSLRIGDSVSFKGATFQVVGEFTADGQATESEAWMDVDVMANVFKRGPYLQSVLVRLESPAALDTLQAAVDADRRLTNTLFRESDYYQSQSESSTRLMTTVAIASGVIMALGAIFGALNSLYAAVSARAREIAILRAIGYSALPVVTSVIAEAVALSVIGGALGAALGFVAFDGASMSSIGATYAQVAFHFAVTPALVAAGLALAVALGLVGGLLPAVRAARQSVVAGLRARG